jgi:DNA repair ATPase RecN
MKTQKTVMSKIAQIKKEELSSEKVELALVDDIKGTIKQISQLEKIADEVIKAANNVNSALRKVVDDAKYYNKYKKVVFSDLRNASNELYKNIQKVEANAKELGISPNSIPEIDLANKVRDNANEYLSLLNRVNLEFDV